MHHLILVQSAVLRRAAVVLLLVGLFVLGGCANRSYRWESLYRQNIQTVAVPIFTSKSFERGVELQLTQAVIQQLELRTPYKVVDQTRADTILQGEIVRITQQSVSRHRRAAIPQEQLYVITVNFTWKDLRTGEILTHRQSFEQTAPFYPMLAEGRDAGQLDAVEELAVAIVRELEADW